MDGIIIKNAVTKKKNLIMMRLMNISVLFILVGFYSCDKNKNEPPKVIEIIPEITKTMAGTKIKFTCNVSDENELQLTYNWTSSCGSFIEGADTKSARWQAPDEETTCSITVLVKDGEYSDEHSFSVIVEKAEEPQEPAATLVGVYYYPWYSGSDFHGRKYLREKLDPVQPPVLGEYMDRDSEVIKQHIEWCEYAGIGLWVSSWWGPGKMEDITLKDHVMKHPDLNEMKIALFYETSGRMKDFTDVSNVASDINYMAKNYFNHPNYYKINGRPVLFIYLTRVLSRNGILENTMNIMRTAANEAGFDIYIVGDQVFGQPPSSTDQIALLDGITNYDVYGSSGGRMYATQEKVNDYYTAQSGWRSKAHQVGVSFVPAASPGFNDRGVRDGHVPLSRKLTENDEFGSLFKAMLDEALQITDPETGNLLLITSWNEWHEDTQIEPVFVAAPTSKDISNSGTDYTAGLEYEGYGLKYLDIIKDALKK
jgi:hypothetical protein